jgi:hypothetical protein
METSSKLLQGLIGQSYKSLFGHRMPTPHSWRITLAKHNAAVARLSKNEYKVSRLRTHDQKVVDKNIQIMDIIKFFCSITLDKRGKIKEINEE